MRCMMPFANAAFGLSDSLVDLAGVREAFTDTVQATGGDLEETLVDFLSDDLLGQTKLRDTIDQHAARFV